MHFILTYYFDCDQEKCNSINGEVLSILDKFEKVNTFQHTFIIQAKGQAEWNKLQQDLSNIANRHGCDFKFLMTPLMVGGFYNGWLPVGQWDKINKIIGND